MSAEPRKLVSYRRVSTGMQEASGLGLEGQEIAVERYRQAVNGQITREFTEVETGTKKRKRPILEDALRHCKRTGATLVIAKLDRLARNVHFLSGLMEAGVDFVAADMPNANPLTLHIMAAVAEDEAKRISDRVKAALEAYKANGRLPKRLRDLYPDGVPPEIAEAVAGKLGASLPQCRNLATEKGLAAARAAAEARRLDAIRANAAIAPRITQGRAAGKSYAAIAAELNEAGEVTRQGGTWSATQVRRVVERVKVA